MATTIMTETVPVAPDANGVMRVGGTRVTLDTVVTAFLEGATAEEIAQQYPVLDLADLYAVIAYYLRHRDDVDAYLLQRKETAAEVRRQNEAKYNAQEIRDRLLARRAVQTN